MGNIRNKGKCGRSETVNEMEHICLGLIEGKKAITSFNMEKSLNFHHFCLWWVTYQFKIVCLMKHTNCCGSACDCISVSINSIKIKLNFQNWC